MDLIIRNAIFTPFMHKPYGPRSKTKQAKKGQKVIIGPTHCLFLINCWWPNYLASSQQGITIHSSVAARGHADAETQLAPVVYKTQIQYCSCVALDDYQLNCVLTYVHVVHTQLHKDKVDAPYTSSIFTQLSPSRRSPPSITQTPTQLVGRTQTQDCSCAAHGNYQGNYVLTYTLSAYCIHNYTRIRLLHPTLDQSAVRQYFI